MTVLPMALFDEVHLKGESRPYRVTRLKVDGAAVGWLQRAGYLLIDLPRPVRRDETITLDLVADVDLLSTKFPEYYHWRLTGNWYPRPAAYGSERADIRVSAALRDPLVPLAGGDVQERSTVNGVNAVRTRLAGPMESGGVAGGRYTTVRKERSGKHVYVSTLERRHEAKGLDDNVNFLATAAVAVRQCLERWLDVPYPFPDLQMIETSFDLDQVPGVIFLNYDDLLPTRDGVPLPIRLLTHRIAREVAHGWFPHVAKITSREESWLGESLADYTSAYCLNWLEPDRQQGNKMFKLKVDEWKAASKSAGDDVSVLLAEHLGRSDSDLWARDRLLRGRGPLVLEGVRQRLVTRHGEEQGTSMFLVWIRYYVRNFTYKPANTRALIAILEKTTGESWQAYFEQYLFGTDPSPVQ